MKLKYAIQIGGIKFLSRLTSNILSGCSIMLSVILILVCVMAIDGIVNIVKSVYRDNLLGRHFAAVENIKTDFNIDDNKIQPNGYGEESINIEIPSDKVINKFETITISQGDQIKNYYSSGFTLNSINEEIYVSPVEFLEFSDPTIVVNALYDNKTFEDEYDGKIPIIVGVDAINSEEIDKIRRSNISSQERYNQLHKILGEVIGQSFTMESIIDNSNYPIVEETDEQIEARKLENVEFVIVGFSSFNFLSDPFSTTEYINPGAITVPFWALEKNASLKEFVDEKNNLIKYKKFYYEFDSKASRDEFVKKYDEMRVNPVLGPIENFSRYTKSLLKVVYAIGGFILTISSFLIFTTINKAVLDSRKEIGVFRSIGAKTWDIRKIYFAYSLILVNLSFAVGFIFSILLNIIPSILWGSDTFYTFASFSSNFDASKPLFAFISFPASIIWFFVIIQIVGLLAALIPSIRATRINPIDALREE